MRLRVGFLLCLFALFLGVGCRKPLTPADNNQAPETWITSAPQDTITVKGKDGPIAPLPGTIPVQYHLYWAGSDVDGAVAGFYYAVVETITTPPPGLPLPNLPGPKPADYHFTARTDTTFIFNVTEASPDRQHAFFIYAVDNKGRPDPTPARFIFNAQDRYPPAINIDDARATSSIWFQSAPGAPPVLGSYVKVITDTFDLRHPTLKDTVPANAVLNFRWHGEPTLSGTYVTGYRYKLDESQFLSVDSSVHSVTYNSGISDFIAPGAKQFTVRAVDFAGGARQTTRRFKMNISPTTWYSGPDRNAYPYINPPGSREYYIDLPNWIGVPSIDGSYLNKDSVQVLPALRPERKTFFEIYKNRIYVRAENDTVDMNSWVVLSSGGFDPDTPYNVQVSSVDPSLPDTTGLPPGSAVVMHPGPYNGSPIGFKGVVSTFLTLNGSEYGPEQVPSLSKLYPNFDPASVQRNTIINGYYGMASAGKAYAIVKAVDGFVSSQVGAQDDMVPEGVEETWRQLAEKVDAGVGNSQENDVRRRVLTFYVDKSPYLVTSDPNFKPNGTPGSLGYPTVYPSRTLDIYLVGFDDDPYDPDVGAKPNRIGGPSASLVMRWSLSFRGRDVNNQPVTWEPDFLKHMLGGGSGRLILSGIVLDPSIVGPTAYLDIELCDCRACELDLGAGRCAHFEIPITVPTPTPATPAQNSQSGNPGPGSSNAVHGRNVP